MASLVSLAVLPDHAHFLAVLLLLGPNASRVSCLVLVAVRVDLAAIEHLLVLGVLRRNELIKLVGGLRLSIS